MPLLRQSRMVALLLLTMGLPLLGAWVQADEQTARDNRGHARESRSDAGDRHAPATGGRQDSASGGAASAHGRPESSPARMPETVRAPAPVSPAVQSPPRPMMVTPPAPLHVNPASSSGGRGSEPTHMPGSAGQSWQTPARAVSPSVGAVAAPTITGTRGAGGTAGQGGGFPASSVRGAPQGGSARQSFSGSAGRSDREQYHGHEGSGRGHGDVWREQAEQEHYRSDHWNYDRRHGHEAYYPAFGYSVFALPAGFLALRYGSRRMFYYGGVWYEPYEDGYIVVRPPIGMVVSILPPDYVTLWVGEIPYFYANDVYYQQVAEGYAVVPPPAPGTYTQAPPVMVAPPLRRSPTDTWYFCRSSGIYYPYVPTCPEGFQAVPAVMLPPR